MERCRMDERGEYKSIKQPASCYYYQNPKKNSLYTRMWTTLKAFSIEFRPSGQWVYPVLLITGKRKDTEILYAGQVFKGKTIDRIESEGNYTLASLCICTMYQRKPIFLSSSSFNFDLIFGRGFLSTDRRNKHAGFVGRRDHFIF